MTPVGTQVPETHFFVKSHNSFTEFRDLVRVFDWKEVFAQNDSNKAYGLFLRYILACYDLAFQPVAQQRNSRKVRKPWIDQQLLKRIKKKNSMYHSFVRTRDPNLLLEFKKYRNKLQSDLKTAKLRYYERLFEDIRNDPKKIWETVNVITGRKKSTQSHVARLNGRRVESAEMAIAMNRHFIKAGAYISEVDEDKRSAILEQSQLPNSIFLSPTNASEVQTFILKLKNNVASGIDGIAPLPVKHIASEISEVLAFIINLTLSTGVFPQKLKVARVRPIHKGGGDDQLSNYRPISVLTVFSKIFEDVIHNRLTNFFNTHKVISPYQYGFQKNK